MPKYVASATYTDEEMLDIYREAMVAVAVKGQVYLFDGREFTNADLDEIRKSIAWFESRISNVSSGLVVNLTRRVR
jgi:hypothetical protein